MMIFSKHIIYSVGVMMLFVTTASAQVFTEDFEAGIPNTWAVFDNGVGTGISWDGIPWGTANNAAYILYDCSVASTAEDWLVTPQITPTATDDFLRFFQADPDPSDFGSVMSIRISTQSQTNPADFTTIYTQGESVLTPFLESHQVDLSAYVDQPIYIAFVMSQNCGDRWIIDNVEVREECSIDLSMSATGNTLTSNQAGAIYEWSTCTPLTVTGDTTQSITVTDVNQFFRVKITMPNGCEETSVCYNLATLGVADNRFKEEVSIYPNPTEGDFSIDLGKVTSKTTVTITNVMGKVIKTINATKIQKLYLKLTEPAGVYFLNVASENKQSVFKLIKK